VNNYIITKFTILTLTNLYKNISIGFTKETRDLNVLHRMVIITSFHQVNELYLFGIVPIRITQSVRPTSSPMILFWWYDHSDPMVHGPRNSMITITSIPLPNQRLISTSTPTHHSNEWDPLKIWLRLNLSHTPINGPPPLSKLLPVIISPLWCERPLWLTHSNHTHSDRLKNPHSFHLKDIVYFEAYNYSTVKALEPSSS